jgi:hypothetical protein
MSRLNLTSLHFIFFNLGMLYVGSCDPPHWGDSISDGRRELFAAGLAAEIYQHANEIGVAHIRFPEAYTVYVR